LAEWTLRPAIRTLGEANVFRIEMSKRIGGSGEDIFSNPDAQRKEIPSNSAEPKRTHVPIAFSRKAKLSSKVIFEWTESSSML
jgi:hypothetical protein